MLSSSPSTPVGRAGASLPRGGGRVAPTSSARSSTRGARRARRRARLGVRGGGASSTSARSRRSTCCDQRPMPCCAASCSSISAKRGSAPGALEAARRRVRRTRLAIARRLDPARAWPAARACGARHRRASDPEVGPGRTGRWSSCSTRRSTRSIRADGALRARLLARLASRAGLRARRHAPPRAERASRRDGGARRRSRRRSGTPWRAGTSS